MAQIKLLPGLIKSLSGTVGDMTFRTINGKTYMHERHKPGLPEHPTRKQRAQYTKQVIVGECVGLIQKQMNDITDAINRRKIIYNRVARLYDKLAPTIRTRTKLMRAILDEYARFA